MLALEGDRAWVAAFQRGDRDALARVFRAYASQVGRQVRVGRVPEHEVEAVVADVFMKAFSDKARASWDGVRPFGAWLNTMTKNLVIDRGRKLGRLELRAPDDMPTQLDPDPDPAAAHDATELHRVLSTFRASMSDDEVLLFRARFEEGASLGTAAKVLGWSEIRVRRLDTALRARLLQTFQKAGFMEHSGVKIGKSLLGRKPSVEG